MSNNRLFTVLMGAALLIVAVLTFRLAVVTTETVAAASDEAAIALGSQPETVAAPPAPGISFYRSPQQDRCFDVPLHEAASCRASDAQRESESAISFRSPLAECFDVPLWETCDR
jgi:hypothetical protein